MYFLLMKSPNSHGFNAIVPDGGNCYFKALDKDALSKIRLFEDYKDAIIYNIKKKPAFHVCKVGSPCLIFDVRAV